MNVDVMHKIADTIEEADRFNLHASFCGKTLSNPLVGRSVSELAYNCDTVGCVAGWTCAVLHPSENFLSEGLPSWGKLSDVAQADLGLTDHQTFMLFHNSWLWRKMFPEANNGQYTAKHAAYLLHAIADGELNNF